MSHRLELDNRLSPHFRGYTRLGHEITQGRPDAREQLDFGPERPAVEDYPPDQPYWLVQGPNLLPDRALPELRTVCMAWADRMSRVGAELLSAIAVSLELPEGYFDEPFRDSPAWMAKLVHYVGGVVADAGPQGVGAHADYGFVTLLLQDQVGGLQVLPPGSDTGFRWSRFRGPWWSTSAKCSKSPPRATWRPPSTASRRPRPESTATRSPSSSRPGSTPSLSRCPLPPALAARSRGVTDDPDNPMLASYGANVLKGWLRAHPEVARIHHPELVRTAGQS